MLFSVIAVAVTAAVAGLPEQVLIGRRRCTVTGCLANDFHVLSKQLSEVNCHIYFLINLLKYEMNSNKYDRYLNLTIKLNNRRISIIQRINERDIGIG
jgi:hypothetical protein